MDTKLIRMTTVPISLKVLLKGQLRFMAGNGYTVIGISSNGPALKEVQKDEGIRTVSIEMTRVISPLSDLKALWQCFKLFRRLKPTIVHTHTPKAGTIGMIAGKLAGVPIRMHTVAGLPLLEVTGLKRTLLNLVEKITYRYATKIYPNSFALKDIIVQAKFCTADKLKVFGNGSSNGIDTSYFDPSLFVQKDRTELRLRYGIGKADFVFIFIGRLVTAKGVNELVSAFNTLSRSVENIRLMLVGQLEQDLDPLLPKTERILRDNKKIIRTGFQADVRPFLFASDIMAFPSYREGFPNVVLQAGAMGLPAIVSNINGCNEIIINSKNGIVIPVKSETALIKGMKSIVENQDFYSTLKNDARELVKSRFGQAVIWEAILEEYRKLEKELLLEKKE